MSTPTRSRPGGPRLRAALDGLPTYTPGRGTTAAATSIKLSSNENAQPPIDPVVRAIAGAADTVNRYPDFTSGELVGRLAELQGVHEEQIAVGAGSVALCQQLLQATSDAGDEVIFAWRSFEAYPILTQIAGARAVTVPLLSDGRHDVEAMAAAVTDRTRLVFVCNPNNPTGTTVDGDELEFLLRSVPPTVLVVLDEAYREFVEDPAVPDGLELLARHPHLCVLRTFSKAYGLAGLRVGYATGHADVIAALRQTTVPFSVTTLGQRAACAALDHRAEMLARTKATTAERDRVLARLTEAGWPVLPSQANFVWLELLDDARAVAEGLAARGVMVRPFDGEGLRITIGTPRENDALLDALGTPRRNSS